MDEKFIINKFIDSIIDIINTRTFGLVENKYGDIAPIDFNSLEENIFFVDSNVNIKFGMSKFVIVPSQLNKVIKIPFFGIYRYAINEKNSDYEDEDGNTFIFEQFRTNYCQEEYEKYCDLWEQNLNCFVAKTTPYQYNNIEVFLQEKILPNNDYDNKKNPSAISTQIVREWIKEDRACINNDWLANCIDIYGKAKTERFLDYCNNEDPDIIDDLHDGNIGYRFNGTPAILDYTGFYD